ncbi:MAG TPA: Gfo/Idh/MocA family oxidoreductase [Conexibacter sp.]|nr:Gfo/Idh/MocA family oxidoreductase [Conexibacter sp.]
MANGSPPPLRGVVVGLGVMGSNHARVLSTLPGVELVAAADRDATRREAASLAFPRTHMHATLEEAVRDHELDFAAVAVPVDHLPTVGRAALAAGLHVLVEKPTAPSEDEALALASDADARGLVLGVGHIERFNPAVVLLKRKLEEGRIGRVLQMQARRLSPFPNRDSMLGVALDLATHDIDVMRYLTGSEVARVYAETDQRVHERAEDLLCATLRFDDGTTGLLEVNWITPAKVRQLSVTGEHGMFTVDYLTQELCFYEHPTNATDWDSLARMRGGGEGDMVRFALDRREPLRQEWEAFLGAVRDGTAAPVSARDGAAALSTAHAIRRAGTTHEVVVPAYPGVTVA